MPINEFNNAKKYKANKELPTHLEHKPVYAIPYVQFDGMYADNTDCQYLSIGLAQWDSTHVSLKTMRFRDKWSRQSEELPLHRVVDSTLLLSKVLFDSKDNKIEMERNLFIKQDSTFQVEEEKLSADELERYNKFLDENMDLFKSRFDALYKTLDRLKKEGKF